MNASATRTQARVGAWQGVVLAAVLVAGCGGGNEDDLRVWMEESGRELRGAVRPVPQIRPYAQVHYVGSEADDPFRSGRLELERQRVVQSALRPDTERQREPLEHHALEALRMVGVLSRGGRTQALVQVDGNLHQVGVGAHMGRDFGVVTRIDEDGVTLKELVQDVQGEWVERIRMLNLQEAKE